MSSTPPTPTAAAPAAPARAPQILETAANLASVEGLEGLTIGRLATELGMSKSGLFAHFGSKEELQLATIARGARHLRPRGRPARPRGQRGLPRLEALITAKLAYERGEIFEGGCFFETVRAEFDSRDPGPVRDAIEADLEEWDALMRRAIASAIKAGDLRADTDAEQLQYEIEALSITATLRHQMTGDTTLFARAEAAISARLDARRDGLAPVALLAQDELRGQGDARRRRRVGDDRDGLGDAARQRQPVAGGRLDDDLVVAGLDQRALQARVQPGGLEVVQQVLGLVLEAQDRDLGADLDVGQRDAGDRGCRRRSGGRAGRSSRRRSRRASAPRGPATSRAPGARPPRGPRPTGCRGRR